MERSVDLPLWVGEAAIGEVEQVDAFEVLEASDIQIVVRHRPEGHVFRFGIVPGGLGMGRCRHGNGAQNAMVFLADAKTFAEAEARRRKLVRPG